MADDFLATMIGIVLGLLASIPTALAIAAVSRPRLPAWPGDLPDVTTETPGRELAVIDADFRQVVP